MSYRVLIVEDEKHQQELLADFLMQHRDNFTLSGIASSVPEARALIGHHNPDLVFLDVQLEGGTSFDLLSSVTNLNFDIIFTTSFEQYAVKAFRLSAVDYLLKPFGAEELSEALEKFLQKKSATKSSEHILTLLDNISSTRQPAKIALPTLTGFMFVPVKDIVRCESDNTYTTFYVIHRKEIIVSRTLKECEQLLAPYNFYRVHNSHLINLDYIDEYIKGEGGIVKMMDGSQIDVSRRRKDDFLRLLKKVW